MNVFVGLSGGVDSATSAALLKERGHDVTGVFIKIWQPEFIECTWREDRLDAMRAAAYLDIPYREIDLSDEYKESVVNQMIADYKSGVTPNPDVLCNEKIKFGVFFDWALSKGADAVATGHYARIQHQADQYFLLRGVDAAKDQSYFLHRMTQHELSRTLFPVGEYTKNEIREKAERLGLPVARKRDSQGLCFVGDVTLEEFLKRYISVTPGIVRTIAGEVVGEHNGAALYTIGQRHGFTSRSSDALFVVSIDAARNELVVSPNKSDAAKDTCAISNVQWTTSAPRMPLFCDVQTRYRETPIQIGLKENGGNLYGSFAQPHLYAPGQSIVFYKGDQCLGGGVIANQQIDS